MEVHCSAAVPGETERGAGTDQDTPKSARLPRNFAVITDDSRRWARAHGCSVIEGYRAGVETCLTRLGDALRLGLREVASSVHARGVRPGPR